MKNKIKEEVLRQIDFPIESYEKTIDLTLQKVSEVLDEAISGVPKNSQTEAVLDVIKQKLKLK